MLWVEPEISNQTRIERIKKRIRMKVLVIGKGCREHAIIKALLEDEKTSAVYSLPERASLKETISLPASFLSDPEALAKHLKKEGIGLVVIGPEQPLAEGLSDILRSEGLKVFGPCAKSAQLESSKIFAKQFMKERGIPTASYLIVSSVAETLQAGENFFPPFVLKADGLAGGKGVFICKNRTELEEKARFLFEKKALGPAGDKALLEDFQSGQEVSVFVLTNGESYSLLPFAQDYKRLGDKNEGPNTGGMGAIAPRDLSKDLTKKIEDLIIKPTLQGLRDKKCLYRGVLYLGLMIHKNFPKVLEYNVRFGDPEAQVLLPLLDGSWRDVFYQIAKGDQPQLKWKKLYSACVALCAKNYPEGPVKPVPINGLIYYKTENSWFIHGSLSREDDRWLIKSGRALNAVALGKSLKEAVKRAYQQAEKISWPGILYRKDIGKE